ncbi:hypothetical protein D9619_007938 [Psilocybe cf. subviscida]|uniref:F-box domain-containing protein n=1 Tax=Psilocybe cf. subviscida TaxID=2480587 RepID=A0A8H5ATE5_9AGAR|nr:hypothetical protein D9619_007938 [Psilocybe cf. subviscida]
MESVAFNDLSVLWVSPDYVPMQAELGPLNSLIGREIKLLANIEIELCAGQEPVPEKERQHGLLAQRIWLLSACASPIRRVPDDILQEIFMTCLPFDTNPTLISVKKAPILLTHVCRRWKNLAFSTASLWSHFSIPLYSYKPPYIEVIRAVQEWLARSNKCTLNLSFARHITPNPQRNEAIHKSLISQSYRWDTIDMVTDQPTWGEKTEDIAWLTPFLSSSVPLLRSVTLVLQEHTVTLWRDSKLLSGPNLTSLTMDTRLLPPSPTGKLIPFSSATWPRITHLSVTCEYPKRPPSAFFMTLNGFSALVTLDIKICHCVAIQRSDTIAQTIMRNVDALIILPSLRQLHIDSECPQMSQSLLQNLVAPALVSLWYNADNCGHCLSDKDESEENLCSLLKASGLIDNNNLRRLTLDPTQWPDAALYRLLERLPGLECLALETPSYYNNRFTRVRFERTIVDDAFLQKLCWLKDRDISNNSLFKWTLCFFPNWQALRSSPAPPTPRMF